MIITNSTVRRGLYTALLTCGLVIPVAVVMPAESHADTSQLWGVDSVEQITPANVSAVQAAAGAVPQFWGRYVSDCLAACGSNMTPAEVTTAKANNIAVLLISADLQGNADTGSANGTSDGNQAVQDAVANANAPAGTLIVKDVEPDSAVDSAFLGAWYTAVNAAGYVPGFYLNPTVSLQRTAFCGAVLSTPGFSTAIIDSYEPEPGGQSDQASAAPPLSNADHFSCSGGVYDIYQYVQATATGTNFDEDVAAIDTPGLLNNSNPTAMPGTIAAGLGGDGRLVEPAVAGNGEIFERTQTSAGGSWGGFVRQPGTLSRIAIAANQDGRLVEVGVASNGEIFERTQTTAGGSWGGFVRQPGTLGQIAAGLGGDGRLVEVGAAGNGQVFERTQTTPGGTWGAFVRQPGTLSQLAITANQNGRLDEVGVSGSGAIFERTQTSPGGTWGAFVQQAGALSEIAIAANQNGRLVEVGVASNGAIFERTQTSAGGAWGAFVQQPGGL